METDLAGIPSVSCEKHETAGRRWYIVPGLTKRKRDKTARRFLLLFQEEKEHTKMRIKKIKKPNRNSRANTVRRAMYAMCKKSNNLAVQSKCACTDNARIVTELSDLEVGLEGVILGVNFLCHFFLQGKNEVVAFAGNTAADGEYFGLEDVDEVGNADGEIRNEGVNDLSACLVALFHCGECGLAANAVDVAFAHFDHERIRAFCEFFFGELYESSCRTICFETTVSATGAGSAVLFDDHVTKLSTAVCTAGENGTVEDDAAANACAEGDHDGGFCALCRTCDRFAEGSKVCIVTDLYHFGRDLHLFGIEINEREIIKFDVVCVFHDACVGVYGAGASNACAEEVSLFKAAFRNELFGELCHIVNDGLGSSLCKSGYRAFFQDFEVFVKNTDGDIGTAEIHADDKFHK